MISVTIIAVGKVRDHRLRTLIDEYQKRIAPYAKVTVEYISAESFSPSQKAAAQKREGERLVNRLARITDADVYLLDEKGALQTSIQFARFLGNGSRARVFVIAGALGFSKAVRERFSSHVSLSPLTMPHELALTVLMEQLYRAATILNGKTYHY